MEHINEIFDRVDDCCVIRSTTDEEKTAGYEIIKQFVEAANSTDLPRWTFHSGLNHQVVKHVLFPTLKFAAVLLTPHQSTRRLPAWSEVINASEAVPRGPQKVSSTVRELQMTRDSSVHNAVKHLSEARQVHHRLERKYNQAMNFNCTEEKAQQIAHEILTHYLD